LYLVNRLIQNLPHDGEHRYHLSCRDGFKVIVEIGPGTKSWLAHPCGPRSRFQIQVKGSDELIAPYLDKDGRLPFVIPQAVDNIISRHGGVATRLR
jgi:hypothetical protein